MRFSVVTISFNQAAFLPRAIESVLAQEGAVEYIVCDPGSTDGSRDIIDSYGDRIAVRVYERDAGPADGLNRGFARAGGDIFCYLNSDDIFLPGAFAEVERLFARHPDVDVLLGHALVIDADDRVLRRVWSEPFRPRAVAYGAHVQIQPSTFIRADAVRRAGGFDADDCATWDLGLLIRLHQSGARMRVVDAFLSSYRLHAESITSSARLASGYAENGKRIFRLLMGREPSAQDRKLATLMRLAKHVRWPRRTLERVRHGPLFGRAS